MGAAPTIFVDADACPVKDEAMRVAERLGLVVTLVSNGGVRPSRDPMVKVVVVPTGADAADDWIVEQAQANDIVLTADIPLASRAIDKGCHVLGFTGKAFTAASIGMALAMRELNQHLRETGESKGHNASFRPADRSAFLSALDTLGGRAKVLAVSSS
ncbi:MAG: YaiI/YqxD family protein [Alphaproteobacteria bacterium]|nr:YaiI/YqxD family protein [Alphaproteobacteria bacterium]